MKLSDIYLGVLALATGALVIAATLFVLSTPVDAGTLRDTFWPDAPMHVHGAQDGITGWRTDSPDAICVGKAEFFKIASSHGDGIPRFGAMVDGVSGEQFPGAIVQNTASLNGARHVYVELWQIISADKVCLRAVAEGSPGARGA